ncbi:MAG TPA: amidohydrolase family protein [Gemmatimonadales bacterium]|nr:amidohydrolase family protein [Gemmatimonadales bacterium]
MLRIRAGRVHPITAPSFEDGAVLVDANGRIAALGPNDKVPQPRNGNSLHFPDAELMPGLVNCHTHLELTQLGGGAKHEEPEFHKWIWHVRTLKEATSAEVFYEAAVAGVRDCWARGVTCVAETGSTGAVMRALHDLGGRGIVYHETFGPDPAQCAASMAELKSAISHLRGLATSQLFIGISPHAPYSVSAPLYQAAADFARRERLPMAVHIAESRAETDFVCDGAGPFAALFGKRSIAVEPQRCSPVAYLVRLGVLGPGTLCIHCVQVNEADVELLRGVHASVAHCPRSNAAHGHGRAPLALFQKANVAVGFGTDSVVSVGELDLWAEAEAAGLRGEAARHALTIEGARALGWEREIGSLEPGKAADLAVFPFADLRPSPPLAALTVVSGRIVHQISAP